MKDYHLMPSRRISNTVVSLSGSLKLLKHTIAKYSEVNNSEFELMQHVYLEQNMDLSIKALSQRMLLCSQAITKISRNLERRGLVAIRKSDQDKRVTFITLTPTGQELVGREEQVREQLFRQSLKDIPESELITTLRVLERVDRATSKSLGDALERSPESELQELLKGPRA